MSTTIKLKDTDFQTIQIFTARNKKRALKMIREILDLPSFFYLQDDSSEDIHYYDLEKIHREIGAKTPTFNEWIKIVEKKKKPLDMSSGKWLMIQLHIYNPTLYSELKNSEVDPTNNPEVLTAFIATLMDMWNKD